MHLCTLDKTQVFIDAETGYMKICIRTWRGWRISKLLHPAIYFCEALKCPIDEYFRRITIMYKFFSATSDRQCIYQKLMAELPNPSNCNLNSSNQNEYGYIKLKLTDYNDQSLLECLNYFDKCLYKSKSLMIYDDQCFCNQIIYIFYLYHTDFERFKTYIVFVLKNSINCIQLCDIFNVNNSTNDYVLKSLK